MKSKIIFLICAIFLILISTFFALAEQETVVITKPNTSVSFNANDFFPAGFGPINVFWDFFDDTYDQGIIITHEFLLNGVYDVTINATNDKGQFRESNKNVIIGGTVPFISQKASFVVISFLDLPNGVYELTIEESNTTNVGVSGYVPAAKFWNITTDMPNGEFNSTLIFVYEDANNDGIVDGGGINENSVKLYFYDDDKWVIVPEQAKNTDTNRFIATVDHFTLFALLAPISSVQALPASSSAGGSGGGGSGGGISINNSQENLPTISSEGRCTETWICDEWSNQSCGKRTCKDENACGTEELKPETELRCSEETKASNEIIAGILVIIVAVIIAFLTYKRQSKIKQLLIQKKIKEILQKKK